jgi:hypothetical protein
MKETEGKEGKIGGKIKGIRRGEGVQIWGTK